MQNKIKYISITALAAVFCLLSTGAEARSSVHMNHITDQTVPPAQGAMHTTNSMPTTSSSTAQNTGVWDKTKEVTGDVWQGTKEVTSDVWDGTKEVTSDVWDGAKKVGSDVSDAVSGDGGAPTSNPPATHPIDK
ncbi:MAG: hypothetical protein IJ738_03460 [Alphaproteobacteria bacterium]|nr:hypothetical protein [Alphaproteobacteria bacterium]MBR1756608.1 hypothetical protein [Alphaproteobacteria bacterium]